MSLRLVLCRCAVLLLGLFASLRVHAEPTCLWVSSYHQGYEWNDGIERGLEQSLQGVCRLERFFMDTKRNSSREFGEARGNEAAELIKQLQPDVVILSDDNAQRYLALPHLRGSKLPLVFCGVNWDVSEYGYPWHNATGMVEVAPVRPLLEEVLRLIERPRRGLYLSSDVPTEHMDQRWFQRIFAEADIKIEGRFVSTFKAWQQGYRDGQRYDFLVVGNYAGIADWDAQEAKSFARQHASSLVLTNYDWMMPYAMLAKTKLPEEQGRWAGQVAADILAGGPPSEIPVIPNRQWQLHINPTLLKHAGIKLPAHMRHIAIRAGE